MVFLVLFVVFVMLFFTLLYIVYPRVGNDKLPEAPEFNDAATALT